MVLWAALSSATPVSAERTSLESDRTSKVLELMAGVELLPRMDIYTKPFRVRLYTIWEGLLECDGGPVRCPQFQLCILITRSDLPEQRQAYLLPVSYGWRNPRLLHTPNSAEGDGFFVLEVEENIISKAAVEDDQSTWYDARTRRVRFNMHEAYLK
ncbi:MAG: hypothetical protein H7837_14255 [Magnetococcus sp. MYC-9]